MADGSSSSGMTGAQRGGVRGWPRTGRGWLAEISDAVVSVFFPSGCRICERLLTSASRVPICEGCLAADVVVPVPLHRERERERRYNQAALLSNPLAKRLRLPHKAVLLMRTRARPDKQVLSLEERWESVRGAFATRPGSQVDNMRVLLVDDVLTTGATLDACARALRDAGARSVIGLTAARAVRNPLPSTREW